MKKILTFLTLFGLVLTSGILHASEESKVLIVLTSHSELGETGEKTGFWLPELTHPYYELKKAGFTVDVASVQGGMAPLDAKSLEQDDPYNEVFLKDAELMAKVIRSIPLAKVKPGDYKAVLFSGGSGPMWDFVNNKDISRISSSIYEKKGIVSAVCHGNAALVDIKLSNGDLLVKGKRVATFTNEEEKSLGTEKIVPFLLQDKLIERGAVQVYGKAWQENVVVDGQLITGQNPASAKKVAEEIIQLLKK